MGSERRTAFVGYGAFGQQLHRWLEDSGERISDPLIFDDTLEGDSNSIFPFKDALDDQWKDCRFVVGLGYHHLPLRFDLITKFKAAGRQQLGIRHPSAVICSGARISVEAVICPGACVDHNAAVNSGAVIHQGAVICHDSKIGPSAYVGPGATICGNVSIAAMTFIGAGTVVVDGVKVGEHCQVGAGSLVAKDLASGISAVGNPLRMLDRPLRL